MWILTLEPEIAVPIWLVFMIVMIGVLYFLKEVEKDDPNPTGRKIIKHGRWIIAAGATLETALMLLSVAMHSGI